MPVRQHSSTSIGSVRNVALLSAWTATRPKREGAPKVSTAFGKAEDQISDCNQKFLLALGTKKGGEVTSMSKAWTLTLKVAPKVIQS